MGLRLTLAGSLAPLLVASAAHGQTYRVEEKSITALKAGLAAGRVT